MPDEQARSWSYFYNPSGACRLTLVDAESESLLKRDLPSHAKWIDVKVHLTLFSTRWYGPVRHAGYLFLNSFCNLDPGPSEARCQHDWVQRAARYLKSVVRDLELEPTSDVERVTWDSTAELFRVNTA